MQLLEYQAKRLLKLAGVPIPTGRIIGVNEVPGEVTFPIVVKSQVPVGGRGKLGGIRIVKNNEELGQVITDVSALSIKGHLPSHLLLEQAVEIRRELYLSLQVNRDDRRIEWIVSENGGVEVESHSESVVIIDCKDASAHEKLSNALDIPTKMLSPLLAQLEHCFDDNDLLLLEVNPLVLTNSNTLICADAKIIVDDNSRFRHAAFDWPDAAPIKPLGGTVGVIANGAGMAMSTMDAIYASGAKPANFLDIGGGTGEDVFVNNLRFINGLSGVTCVIVNIFAGITHCDDIARGIIAAKQQIPKLVPLFIRLEGTNRDEAAKLLSDAGVSLEPSLAFCVIKAGKVAK